jgi:hypothetical protein
MLLLKQLQRLFQTLFRLRVLILVGLLEQCVIVAFLKDGPFDLPFDAGCTLNQVNGISGSQILIDGHGLLQFVHQDILGDLQLLQINLMLVQHVKPPPIKENMQSRLIFGCKIRLKNGRQQIMAFEFFYFLFLGL